jgi:hypothetical protein
LRVGGSIGVAKGERHPGVEPCGATLDERAASATQHRRRSDAQMCDAVVASEGPELAERR